MVGREVGNHQNCHSWTNKPVQLLYLAGPVELKQVPQGPDFNWELIPLDQS